MKTRLLITLAFTALFVLGCVNENEEEVFAKAEQNMTDTTSKDSTDIRITYELNVKPIMEENCTFCHDTDNSIGAGIDFDSYAELKNFADDGSLLGAVRHESGFSRMPKNSPKLDADLISTLEAWVNGGTLEN